MDNLLTIAVALATGLSGWFGKSLFEYITGRRKKNAEALELEDSIVENWRSNLVEATEKIVSLSEKISSLVSELSKKDTELEEKIREIAKLKSELAKAQQDLDVCLTALNK